MTTYDALAYRDESGTWCGRVDALHANTDASSFLELRSNLIEAVEVSLDEPDATPIAVTVYVRTEDIAAAEAEIGRAG